MKKVFTLLLSAMGMMFGASQLHAQTTLASWTFDNAYDTTVDGKVTTYTPNASAATDVTGWFNSVTPVMRPDSYVGEDISQYALTAYASNRYYQLCSGYNNRVLRIDQNVSNAISDLTDGSQHDNYYEISFPTLNYKNVTVNYACAYGGNAEATLNIVVSVDGGATWTLAGTKACASGWWLYNAHSVTISAANKGQVIVRLICGNDWKSNWNLDYINVTGEYSTDFKTMYQLHTSTNPAGAGAITVTPSGSEFEEGTALSVVASENFGYHFVNWTDGNGTELGTGKTYAFEINAETTLVANYTQRNTYELTYAVEGGARDYFVTLAPAPTIVEGKTMYEEGSVVTLTAAGNEVLSFLKWEDNSTNNVRQITMTSNKHAVATYDASDYIVGWDLVVETPKSQRAADFCADDTNPGMMMLTNDGTTQRTWLSHTGWVGHHCAISWQGIADKYYFQWQFATTGKKNVTFKLTASAINYSRYTTYDLQYSLDNVSWNTAAVFDFTTNTSWTTKSMALPAACDDQSVVYVRLRPSADAVVAGSGNDCLAVTDIFVTYDKGTDADDVTAPQLVSMLPAQNATDVSTNGSVILAFDEAVALSDGAQAMLAGEAIVPTVSGKNVLFAYSALDFQTSYTFTLPAGSITDLAGNAYAEAVTLTFTTAERPQPMARLFDAIVAQDGSGDYTSLQAAIDAAPSNLARPYLIFVKAGVYTGHIDIPATKTYLHIIGEGRDLVSIEDNRLEGGLGSVTPAAPYTMKEDGEPFSVYEGATVVCQAANAYFEGVNLVNTYGRDGNNGPQALALFANADRFILNKCGLISFQDTYLTAWNSMAYRQYVKESWIEGAVDFIYGGGDVFFDRDTINVVRKSGGYIVAPSHTADTKWGYVFDHNVITAPGVASETQCWLGRPWTNEPQTVFLHTQCEIATYDSLWYDHMGGLPKVWAVYDMWDKEGNAMSTTSRSQYYKTVDGQKVYGTAKNALTADEAAQYSLKHVMRGNDAWQPELICQATDAPVVALDDVTLSWEAVPYAICYAVLQEGRVIGFTTETSYAVADSNATYSVKAVNEQGGLSDASNSVGGSTTAITAVSMPTQGEVCYDLYGRRLSGARRGIVLSNGRVVMMK